MDTNEGTNHSNHDYQEHENGNTHKITFKFSIWGL